jgi:hypothetical protein
LRVNRPIKIRHWCRQRLNLPYCHQVLLQPQVANLLIDLLFVQYLHDSLATLGVVYGSDDSLMAIAEVCVTFGRGTASQAAGRY